MTSAILLPLFLPFVFYVLWGPFAFYPVAKALIARLAAGHGPRAVQVQAGLVLTALFAPVIVTSAGGQHSGGVSVVAGRDWLVG